MRESGIRAVWIKKYRAIRHKGIDKELKNILDRQFNPERPNKVWVTDITYIWTSRGFVYLTSVMDLYSRKIISWDVSGSLTVDSVIRTVRESKRKRELDKTLILHSDRGSQYTSREYIKETYHKNILRSYSRKGVPWDNAVIESFHSIIKRECLNRYKLKDEKEVRRIVFEYIEIFYNRKRLHSYCGMRSPEEYEKEENKKISV